MLDPTLHSRTVLVTGAGRHGSIAHGIVLGLAADGWNVAVTTRTAYDQEVFHESTDAALAVLRKQVLRQGVRLVVIEADLSDPTTPERVFAEVTAELGPVSALVLSHSYSINSSILDTTLESFDQHFAVNTRAAWLLLRELARQIPAEGGRFVALTSDHVVHNVPYGASKGALDRLVFAAARELAHLGITANAINPGPMDTGWMNDEIRASGLARQPTGRLGTPADTAKLVRFLLSDDGEWVTGQLIKSDGGFSS
ncbi:SDR family oxidoreductase [Salana multivorans]